MQFFVRALFVSLQPSSGRATPMGVDAQVYAKAPELKLDSGAGSNHSGHPVALKPAVSMSNADIAASIAHVVTAAHAASATQHNGK